VLDGVDVVPERQRGGDVDGEALELLGDVEDLAPVGGALPPISALELPAGMNEDEGPLALAS